MADTDIDYGSREFISTIDSEGSTVSRTEAIQDGKVMHPVKVRKRIRIKVKNAQQELEEYLRFSDEVKEAGAKWTDIAFGIERTRHGDQNGFYYIVKCYTEQN